MTLDAPERWEAQDCILREARFASLAGLHVKAVRLVRIARELGSLSAKHEAEAEQIQRWHDNYHERTATPQSKAA